jgi:hypothetical protein
VSDSGHTMPNHRPVSVFRSRVLDLIGEVRPELSPAERRAVYAALTDDEQAWIETRLQRVLLRRKTSPSRPPAFPAS